MKKKMTKKEQERMRIEAIREISMSDDVLDDDIISLLRNDFAKDSVLTLDEILNLSSERLRSISSKLDLNECVLISALMEWSLDMVEGNENILNDVILKYNSLSQHH